MFFPKFNTYKVKKVIKALFHLWMQVVTWRGID